jgi:hypothetical protein
MASRRQGTPRIQEMILIVGTQTESNQLRAVASAACRELVAGIIGSQDAEQWLEFQDYFKTALDHSLLAGMAAGYRVGFSDGSISTRLQLKENSQKILGKLAKPKPEFHNPKNRATDRATRAYKQAVSDTYDNVRKVIKDEPRKVLAGILRRHPDWNAREICNRLDSDSRGIELPLNLAGDSGIRLWQLALEDPRLRGRVEKYISRVRIADRVITNEKKWTRQVEKRKVSAESSANVLAPRVRRQRRNRVN